MRQRKKNLIVWIREKQEKSTRFKVLQPNSRVKTTISTETTEIRYKKEELVRLNRLDIPSKWYNYGRNLRLIMSNLYVFMMFMEIVFRMFSANLQ